jgi:hypothetical protein
MARNAVRDPSMPALKSDSDTSDSEEELPPQRQQPHRAFPPSRMPAPASASASRLAPRSDHPSLRPPLNSNLNPAGPMRDTHATSSESAQGSTAPVSQQRISPNPPPSPAPIPPMSSTSGFSRGNCVRVVGLQRRADLNGCPGYVCGEMEKASERWEVRVIKGPRQGSEPVKLRSYNMTIIHDLDAFDPGYTGGIPPEIASKGQAAIQDHKRRWHRAALHLIGRKFYCSLRPLEHQFADGFDMDRIQKALEDNSECVKSGIPLIYQEFRQIAFASDDLEDLFTLYFRVLPEALKGLPWKGHKFSVLQPSVLDFRSAPLSNYFEDPLSPHVFKSHLRSIDVFGSSSLVMMLQIQYTNPAIFSSSGIAKYQHVSHPNAIHLQPLDEQPCRDTIELLTKLIYDEFRGQSPAYDIRLIYR